jgi:hypothetical protein
LNFDCINNAFAHARTFLFGLHLQRVFTHD